MKLPLFLSFRSPLLQLALSALLFCKGYAAESNDPADELASFQLAEGFEATLFASEKEGVLKPIQIRFDAKGRLWVIGTTVYPQIAPGQTPNDKVLILEDTDRDGKVDKTTVFAEGLLIPTGIELTQDGAYIGHGAELLHLRDTNGDDKADERKVVLRGFGTGDNHQNINSFLWGPGGELWMCQGLHIYSNVETPWGISRLEKAGIWRFRPHLLKLDGFYGSEYEPQNPWGFVFTDSGEPIVLAGNNSSPIYAVPGLVVNHRKLPPPLIWKNGGGRKVGGGDIVRNAHFPDHWQGLLIVGGYINNAVWSLQIKEDGAGFVLEDAIPLIKSTYRSFRPVDVKFGPDGALYVCDWYNPIIGHYQASFRHPDRDKSHGRIWRVTAKNRPLVKQPSLTTASTEELLKHLNAPDRWTRHFAKRVLAEKPSGEVAAKIKQWAASGDQSESALMEALGVLQSHEEVSSELVGRLIGAKDASVRAYAAGAIGPQAGRLPTALTWLKTLANDSHPRVRLHAIVSSSYIQSAEAMSVALIAADQPQDRFIEYAFKQTAFALKPSWLSALRTGNLDFQNRVERLSTLIHADGTSDTLPLLRELLQSQDLNDSSRLLYWKILAELGGTSDLEQILKMSDSPLQAEIVPIAEKSAVRRNLKPAGDPALLLAQLWQSQTETAKAAALRLSSLWKVDAFYQTVDSSAMNPMLSDTLRRAAIEALGQRRSPESRTLLERILTDPSVVPSSTPQLRGAALAALSGIHLKDTANFAATFLRDLNDEAVAQGVFQAFLERQDGPEALAAAFEKNPPHPASAKAGLSLMNSTGRRNDKLAAILNERLGASTRSFSFAGSEMDVFVRDVQSNGDPQRGKKVFQRPELGCIACHIADGEGGIIGPSLENVGSAQPIDFIVGAILEPQKEIKEGYTSVSILTKSGEEYQGYQIGETVQETIVRDPLQGKDIPVRKDSIQERKLNGSVMPSGLVDTLTKDEFRDLVRYLSELGKTKKAKSQ